MRDYEGIKVGCLTVLYRGLDKKKLDPKGQVRNVITWDCQCDCGNIVRGAVMAVLKRSPRRRRCNEYMKIYDMKNKLRYGIKPKKILEIESDLIC